MNTKRAPLYTQLICKELGYTDTEELKLSKFYINDDTWTLYEVDDSNWTARVDNGYKIQLISMDGLGACCLTYYQEDFLSLLERGYIVPYKEGVTHIEHVTVYEPFVSDMYIVHKLDTITNSK